MAVAPTRVDTGTLRAALDRVTELLAEAEALLDPLLAALPDDDRKRVPRAPVRFAGAGRVLAAVASDAPDLSARARFDPDAVTEDLDNLELLGPVTARLEALTRRLDDSRLVWLAEAYVPALRLYKLAQVCAQDDGRLDVLVRPLQDVFAQTRRRKPAPAEPAPAPEPTAAPAPAAQRLPRARPAPAKRADGSSRHTVVVRLPASPAPVPDGRPRDGHPQRGPWGNDGTI